MKLKYLLATLLMIMAHTISTVGAQNVDIQLRNTSSVLEVWLIPKADYSGIVSGLTFTISWDVAYNVDLTVAGTETVFVPSIPLQSAGNTAGVSITNGTRKYRTYSSSGGNSSISLTNNAAIKLMSVPVPRTSRIQTGTFSISNDAFTNANNLNYYFDIAGRDITGTTSSMATNVTIPLELIEFKGIEQNNSAYLTWKTVSEINFSHFEVERLDVGLGISDFGKIAVVPKSDIRNPKYTEGVYFLTDDKAFTQSKLVLYRLKMINTDSSFKYSNVISVLAKEAANETIKLYPNPTQSNLQLTIESLKEGTQIIDITDATGKLCQHSAIALLKGQNQQTLDVSALPSGIYFLSVLNEKGIKQTFQFIKL